MKVMLGTVVLSKGSNPRNLFMKNMGKAVCIAVPDYMM